MKVKMLPQSEGACACLTGELESGPLFSHQKTCSDETDEYSPSMDKKMFPLIAILVLSGCSGLDSFIHTDTPCILPSVGAMGSVVSTCSQAAHNPEVIAGCALAAFTNVAHLTLCELAVHHVLGQHDPRDPYDSNLNAAKPAKKGVSMRTPPIGAPVQFTRDGNLSEPAVVLAHTHHVERNDAGTRELSRTLVEGTVSVLVFTASGNVIYHALEYSDDGSDYPSWHLLDDDVTASKLRAQAEASSAAASEAADFAAWRAASQALAARDAPLISGVTDRPRKS